MVILSAVSDPTLTMELEAAVMAGATKRSRPSGARKRSAPAPPPIVDTFRPALVDAPPYTTPIFASSIDNASMHMGTTNMFEEGCTCEVKAPVVVPPPVSIKMEEEAEGEAPPWKRMRYSSPEEEVCLSATAPSHEWPELDVIVVDPSWPRCDMEPAIA